MTDDKAVPIFAATRENLKQQIKVLIAERDAACETLKEVKQNARDLRADNVGLRDDIARLRPSEYLVSFKGTWYIARPGVCKMHQWCQDILAFDTEAEQTLQLVWCERDGSVLGPDSQADEVRELPS